MARKMSMGRRKIQMRMIAEKDARQVAFSKRRSGLFKKANELCTLTGCEIAIIVFSPGGKPFSFGYPSVETVLKRFLGRSPIPFLEKPDPRMAIASALNQRYADLTERVDVEKRQGEKLKEIVMENQNHCWLETPIDDLSSIELAKTKMFLEDLRIKIAKRIRKLLIKGPAPPPVNPIGAIDLNVAISPEI